MFNIEEYKKQLSEMTEIRLKEEIQNVFDELKPYFGIDKSKEKNN